MSEKRYYFGLSIVAIIVLFSVPMVIHASLPSDVMSGYREYEFNIDGQSSHYYVERANSSNPGYVNISWNALNYNLEIETKNIENFTIDCFDIYSSNKDEIWHYPGTSPYWYSSWIESQPYFEVHLLNDKELKSVSFFDIRVDPIAVTFNSNFLEWENNGYTIDAEFPIDYATGDDIIYIYFEEEELNRRAADEKIIEVKEKDWSLVHNPFGDNLDIEQILDLSSVEFVSYKTEDEYVTVNWDNGYELSPHQGFYVWSKTDIPLTVVSTDREDNSIYLNYGWNIVGLPWDVTVSDLLDSDITAVSFIENEEWVTYIYESGYEDTTINAGTTIYVLSNEETDRNYEE